MMISIDRLPALPKINPTGTDPAKTNPASGESFADTFKQFVSGVNEMQNTATVKDMKFATGEIKDVHEVMAASEEANISLMLLLEVRNKAMDAYRELMRISV
jgi:flagellar hook-basal body complex protein FliE